MAQPGHPRAGRGPRLAEGRAVRWPGHRQRARHCSGTGPGPGLCLHLPIQQRPGRRATGPPGTGPTSGRQGLQHERQPQARRRTRSWRDRACCPRLSRSKHRSSTWRQPYSNCCRFRRRPAWTAACSTSPCWLAAGHVRARRPRNRRHHHVLTLKSRRRYFALACGLWATRPDLGWGPSLTWAVGQALVKQRTTP